MATMMVLRLISTAPRAGLMTIPALKSTPAANGMATTLYPVAQMNTKEGLNQEIGENPGLSCCALSCRCKGRESSYLNGLNVYLPDECTPFILNAFIF